MYLAADMMDEGAGDLKALAFEDAVQALGADFSTWADHDSVNAGMTVLKRNFDKGLQLAVDAIRRPRFEGAEWERVKRLHLDDLKQQDDQPQVVASRVASRILFGDEHPYGRPVGVRCRPLKSCRWTTFARITRSTCAQNLRRSCWPATFRPAKRRTHWNGCLAIGSPRCRPRRPPPTCRFRPLPDCGFTSSIARRRFKRWSGSSCPDRGSATPTACSTTFSTPCLAGASRVAST